MSAYLLGMAWKANVGTANRKIVLMRLVDAAKDDGTNIFPSIDRVAKDTQLHPRSVQRIVHYLVDEELLVVVANHLGGRGRAREYRLDLEVLFRLTQMPVDEPDSEIDGDQPDDEAVEKGAAVSPFNGTKGDTDDIKGAAVSPFSSAKGDSHDIKGDSHDIKGDRAWHPTPYTPQDPSDKTVDEFWEKFIEVYPRLGPHDPAKDAFEGAVIQGADPGAIVDAAVGAAHRWRIEATEQQYIPYAKRWLSEKRYLDKKLRSAATATRRYMLQPDTPEWDALIEYRRAAGECTKFMEGQLSWQVAVEKWPANLTPPTELKED